MLNCWKGNKVQVRYWIILLIKQTDMSIDEILKENLIADVENICDITLDVGFKTSLKRAFEITIGHHYSQPKPAVEQPEQKESITDAKIQSLAEELYPDSLGKQVTFCEEIIWFIDKTKTK